jgi:hypothetical protein
MHTPTKSDHFLLFSFIKSSTILNSSFPVAFFLYVCRKIYLH